MGCLDVRNQLKRRTTFLEQQITCTVQATVYTCRALEVHLHAMPAENAAKLRDNCLEAHFDS